MNIKIVELQLILNKVSKYLKFQNEIKIENDFYKVIGSDNWHDVYNDTIKPDIGSLKDDWESIKKNVFEREIVTPVDLDRLSSVLRAISQRIFSI